MKPVKIEVVSDVVCPWCFIGKRRLENATALVSDIAVEVHWRPFFLEPGIPRAGITRDEFVRMHFGSVKAYQERTQATIEAASMEGLVYRPHLIERQPNTIDCHRLVRWAGRDPGGDKAGIMEQRLMELFLMDGGDLTSLDVLVQAAADCGMDAERTRLRLGTDEDVDVVKTMARGAAAQGISGVPTYIFADKYETSGAQPTAWFGGAIRQISAGINAAAG